MAERDIQADILVAITALPRAFFVRTNTGAGRMASGQFVRFNMRGTPDIIGCYHGKYVVIEVKAAKGRQRLSQFYYQSAVETADGLYIVARSVDDVLAALQKLVP